MAKVKTPTGSAKGAFFCSSCGTELMHWAGRCPECREWDTVVAAPSEPHRSHGSNRTYEARPLAPEEQARPLSQIPEPDPAARVRVPMPEIARVLGGALVPGSAVLVAGDPGVGKSTLLLELAEKLAAAGSRCLYASAEESAAQTRLRARRLGAASPELLVLARSGLEDILAECRRTGPAVVVVDSIQMTWSPEFPGAAGSVGQVRQCAAALIREVKESGAALFLVGHVTKDGTIAGPRVLEHMVDTVLHFETAGQGAFRQLRAVKNRFGPTDEVAFFEMTEGGLVEVAEPSALLLGERGEDRPGAAVFPALGGSRILLVEIQALAAPAAEGYAHRRAAGLDANRLHMLLAVLARRGGMQLAGCDVFANAAGGLEVSEPAADLPLAAAVASSLRERPVPAQLALAGEVGLGGELRAVPRAAERVREAARHGLQRIILPRASARGVAGGGDIQVIGAASLVEALDQALA
jgi:DNA repair protein RadA/Sms